MCFSTAGIHIEPITVDQGHLARQAFGDCFAYALAKGTGEALLYKGQDFSKTDMKAPA